MSIKLQRLAEALKINTELSHEDRIKLNELREQGNGVESALEEILAGKILKRISDLVERIEG